MMCLLCSILAYPRQAQGYLAAREWSKLSRVRTSHSSYSSNSIRMYSVFKNEERQSTNKAIPELKSRLKVIKPISFGDKYKVENGLHDTWHVRRPRLWQEKAAGFLLCFCWSNSSMTWTPNTYVKKTKLLTSSGDSMGRGLFAMRDFEEGEVIGQYVGKVVGHSKCKDDDVLKAYVQGTILHFTPTLGLLKSTALIGYERLETKD
jgi:hypothetical protein